MLLDKERSEEILDTRPSIMEAINSVYELPATERQSDTSCSCRLSGKEKWLKSIKADNYRIWSILTVCIIQ